MDTTYNPQAIEKNWYQTWEDKAYFTPRNDAPDQPAYCIMIPPPNVTGTLHMGHAFQDTLMDMLTRYFRMKGDNTLWQMGTDHAGIATQMVVERQLAAEGKSRHDLGREEFIKRVWQWKEESGGTITRQLRRMGSSVDWEHERFTMDEGLSKAVQEVFVRLYREGLIYRGKRLVNWDPVLHTALADLEVISTEENGSMWHMSYPLTDGSGSLVVATTRPETMLGDTAVAVHPDDERYQSYIGKTIALPLTKREIPIIADEYVDKEFGSGCVKITPAHDHNDYEIGQRHDLPIINLFTIDAKLNENAPEIYRGLDRFDARKQIVKDLEKLGLLEKIEPHKLMVPRGDRSHAIVEPYLTDQWFVKTQPLAEEAIKVVEDGRIKFIPENWSKTYFEWMNNIQDWCISRQIWWGHRIPAWYDEAGAVYVGYSEADVRQQYNIPEGDVLRQDNDVLDTWFSSALWPFSTLGWPDDTERLKAFYPTNVLVTGFDIIFFWVARMIMMGLKFMGDVPFREVYIHGLVRDANGDKMSKSKGNVLDPLDLIDGIELEPLLQKRSRGLMQPEMAPKIEADTRKHFPDGIRPYGTDALRFTFAALASTGRDIRFDTGRIEGYRNFCNKLWNATRYVLMQCEDKDTGLSDAAYELTLADRWIIDRLQVTEATVVQHFADYRFDLLANTVYEFTWNEYCDWYLELSKPVLFNEQTPVAVQRGTRRTLVRVLETLLRILHPIMPYITEELWQKVAPLAGKSGDTIMLQAYPQADESKRDAAAVAEVEWLKQVIMGVRRIRSEMNINPGKRLVVLLQNGDENDRQRYQNNEAFIRTLAKLESIQWLEAEETAPESATALAGEMNILIPLAGLIDKDAELQRLQREMDKLDKELQKVLGKLNNPKFVERAPQHLVEKEQQRQAELDASKAQLQVQAEKIRAL
ncbi:valine--tRNA ligase [Candidatus Venteria ishoeyi]|uniref:valine--tRNA ligase n=1 Tax=Candidatus Venteria ishoeyi TaxID=1899563 RepID=UPI0025A63FDA|nr:valine--tRNA ligase [Candidatus Venteria ishoeyi]MDM8545859.1 valine--tRNA ligase [Candidatus Venteria ishoeyi]